MLVSNANFSFLSVSVLLSISIPRMSTMYYFKKSSTVGTWILYLMQSTISSSRILIESIGTFLWAIFSKTVSILKGWISSNLEAMNMEVIPIKWSSFTVFTPWHLLKYLSIRDTPVKKLWSSHLKLVKTSTIQSTILDLITPSILSSSACCSWRAKNFG